MVSFLRFLLIYGVDIETRLYPTFGVHLEYTARVRVVMVRNGNSRPCETIQIMVHP